MQNRPYRSPRRRREAEPLELKLMQREPYRGAKRAKAGPWIMLIAILLLAMLIAVIVYFTAQQATVGIRGL